MPPSDSGEEEPYSLPSDIEVGEDGSISPEELAAHFDSDHDGKVTPEEFAEVSEKDRVDRNLERIRARREGRKGIFSGPEGVTFLFGLAYGVVFFGLISSMSTGILGSSISDSVWMDSTASETILDPGEGCLDSTGVVWINVWIDNDYHLVKMEVNNLGERELLAKELRWELHAQGGASNPYEDSIGNLSEGSFDFSDIPDGEYELRVFIHNLTALVDSGEPSENWTRENITAQPLITGQALKIPIEIHTESSKMPWQTEDVVKQEAKITERGERVCLTVGQLGKWGWGLMGAEWAGGRETAMLTGGSAGVPAWWMSFISLSMSIFFLCIQYPLMYRFYHKDVDDILSDAETERVVQRALKRCEKAVHISIDWDNLRLRRRDLSIDVFVPYEVTETSVIEPGQIKLAMVKEVLSDFKAYGEMAPLQLKARGSEDHTGVFESLSEGRSDVEVPELDASRPALVSDYSDFFGGIHASAALEKRVEGCLKDFMKTQNLEDRGYWIGVDEHRIAVRLIYKPKVRFAFFNFGRSYIEIQDELKSHLIRTMDGKQGDREFNVSCRNEVATLADRSGAGRTESASGNLEGQAFTARQDGLAGTLLQSQFMGDILSSVEFVAHENRHRIDRWGFWGLIVFVWIPFMASGVLVGAMLGLVARMSFLRVLTACFIGGAAASITWAYTAEGIIEILHAANADLFIPIIIGIIFLAAIIHLRTTKKRRAEELFQGSLAFFQHGE